MQTPSHILPALANCLEDDVVDCDHSLAKAHLRLRIVHGSRTLQPRLAYVVHYCDSEANGCFAEAKPVLLRTHLLDLS